MLRRNNEFYITMKKFKTGENMITGEIINLILAILSFILAAISVITVVLTLRQNNKMIEATSRAYIVVNAQYINFRNPQIVLVVRNYGSSGAIIKKLVLIKTWQNTHLN